jgi:hypothetical protein
MMWCAQIANACHRVRGQQESKRRKRQRCVREKEKPGGAGLVQSVIAAINSGNQFDLASFAI